MKKLSVIITFLSTVLSLPTYSATVYDKDGTSMDVFGRINAVYGSHGALKTIKGSKNIVSDDPALVNNAYFGMSGRSKLSDNLYGIAFTEWQMANGTNGNNDTKARAQYVGIDAMQYGILTFGRGNNAFYAVAGVTDIFQELDCKVNDHYAFGDYQPGLAMYSLSALGWDFRLSYQSATTDVEDTPINVHNGAAFSMATHLENGLSISYGMSYYYLQHDSQMDMARYYKPQITKMYYPSLDEIDDETASSLRPTYKIDKGVSVSYGTFGEGLYLAFNATQTKYNKFTHKLYSYESVLSYSYDNGLRLSAGYGIKRFNGANIMSVLTTGIYYKFVPNFTVFAEAAFDISSKPDRFYSKSQISDLCLEKNKALIGAEYSF